MKASLLIDKYKAIALQKFMSQEGGVWTVYIDKEGGSYDFANIKTNTPSLPIADEAYKYIEESIKKLDEVIGLDFKIVSDPEEAITLIKSHDYSVGGGTSVGVNFPSWSITGSKSSPKTSQVNYSDISLNTSAIASYTGSSSLVAAYGESYWKNTFLHELGHVLGLEHLWDGTDGDASDLDHGADLTVMAYQPAKDSSIAGEWPLWFTDLDIDALTEVWGYEDYPKQIEKNFSIYSPAHATKLINWGTLSSYGSLEEKTYSLIDWSMVDIKGLQGAKLTTFQWSKVDYSMLTTKQYKQIDWSQVNTETLTESNYKSINWGLVEFVGKKSVLYSKLDWSKVGFDEFSAQLHKKIDWSKVQTADLTAEQYSDINWSQVKFKGSKAPSLSSLDLSLVINASSFSQKAAKQIDWTQVSADDLSASALSKLSGLGVKKKGVNVAELLKPGTQSKELSFAGVGQAQAGALTTGLEDSGSGAQVLLAAVEKQPVLV